MTSLVPGLNAERAARDRARAEFKRRLGLAKVDLAPAVLKRRAIGEAQRTALSATRQAVDIANDSRGIVAATVAVIVLWLTRKPLGRTTNRLISRWRTRKSLRRRLEKRAGRVTHTYWQRLKDYAYD